MSSSRWLHMPRQAMADRPFCPECGALWSGDQTCQACFYQMLYWENERPVDGAQVHHLMVLCYHIQHPSLYSPEGLEAAIHLLVDFLEGGVTPLQARQRNRWRVDSGRRDWKIKGGTAGPASYATPMRWEMTAVDVVQAGVEKYCEQVRLWARATLDALRLNGYFD